MAVQPIDLQNLLLRVDQISKDQNAQRQAVAQNQAVAGSEIAHRSEEVEHRVRETPALDEGPKGVDEDGSRATGSEDEEHDAGQNDDDQEQQEVLRDLDLGRTIDIVG